ncbi:MAG TPA: class I SAM-dependent methyltransferase [Ilumatobacteraceae bacterium]|nr:class I SAM-dependent methyltransferase [Ilumatobacteraceae bacterium]
MATSDPGSTRSFDPDGVDATLASTLDSLDDAENYRNWIVDLARPHLAGPILEVGAGHGTFTESFATFGEVTAVEPGGHAATVLADRYASDDRVTAVDGVVADVVAEPVFGSAVMINVLEHIADDQGVLREIGERLQPGACLVIWVPAFQFLYSPFDEKLGHVRRYRKSEAERDVCLAGYEVVDARYVNMPGWFSWLLLVRLLRQEPTSPTTVKIFDRYIVPAVRWVEDRVRMPFGQSVFVVARKPLG